MHYKLVVLGDGGVGKTALTLQVIQLLPFQQITSKFCVQLCMNHFLETYDPTIEDSFRKQVVIEKQSCMLEILDTAGQEEYSSLSDQWIRNGEGFVLVYSVTSRDSFSRIGKIHTQIQRVTDSANAAPSPKMHGVKIPCEMGSQPTPGPAPVTLIANKIDLFTERVVSSQEGSALAKQLGCDFVEASAKSCINVDKAFFDVVGHLRRQRQQIRSDRMGTRFGSVHGSVGQMKDEFSKKSGKDKRGSGKDCIIL